MVNPWHIYQWGNKSRNIVLWCKPEKHSSSWKLLRGCFYQFVKGVRPAIRCEPAIWGISFKSFFLYFYSFYCRKSIFWPDNGLRSIHSLVKIYTTPRLLVSLSLSLCLSLSVSIALSVSFCFFLYLIPQKRMCRLASLPNVRQMTNFKFIHTWGQYFQTSRAVNYESRLIFYGSGILI